MFQMFSVGDEFSSYSELATRISNLKKVHRYNCMLGGLEQSKRRQNVPQRT